MPLFAGYADLLRENPPLGERARQLAADHLYELVAMVLDGCREGDATRNRGGVGAARLDLVKRDILCHLQRPDFSIRMLARRQGIITPRYIQRLFEADGVTFSEFLNDSRLDLVFRLLSGSASSGAGISTLAYEAGFHDLSNFNRSFKRRYGVTPSHVRAEALRRMPTSGK